MAPAPVTGATLTSAGNGYFDVSFTPAATSNGNSVEYYRIDFYDADGNLYPNYNGLLIDATELAENDYTARIGGWTVTGGEGTAESPFTYTGLETGNSYTAKIFAVHQSPSDENFHYAKASESAVTLLPEPQLVSFTGISAETGTMGFQQYEDESGQTVTTTGRTLITSVPEPELILTTNVAAEVEAYIGEDRFGTMDENGRLKLTGLTNDGEYAVELHAKNKATGDMSVAIVYVTIDTIKPMILITSPGNASISFSSVPVRGMTEPGSTVKANGVAMRVASDGAFEGTVTLPTGVSSDKIRIVATDAAGNTTSAIVSVTNNNYVSPVGINVVRTGIMEVETEQQLQVFLKYPDGKNDDNIQTYRSERVEAEDRDKLSYDVIQGCQLHRQRQRRDPCGQGRRGASARHLRAVPGRPDHDHHDRGAGRERRK